MNIHIFTLRCMGSCSPEGLSACDLTILQTDTFTLIALCVSVIMS